MVATRRGGRVNSPTKLAEEKQSVVQATPPTTRRTRRAQQDECPAQQTITEACSQQKKSKGGPLDTPATTSKRRCTRTSRLHSPDQPSTPVGSIHEGDTSDVESLCSAVSDIEPPLTRTRGRRTQLREKLQEHETSEVESSSSAVSAAKPRLRSSRSTRRNLAQTSDSAKTEVGDGKGEMAPETESCSSVMSESQRVTRSQRKVVHTRSSARRHTEDSELSEAESCSSSVSGRRPRRPIRPIPMHLEELSESSQSPSRTTRQTKAMRGKAASTEEDDKIPCCDSEGFESGPTYSVSTCRPGRTRSAVSKATVDSESEEEVNSSAGNRGTPCSSRAGSGTSNRRAPTSRRSTKTSGVVLEKSKEPGEEQSLLNDSKLESTVIGEDPDCTLVEEEKIQTSGEQETLDNTELTSSGAHDEKLEKKKTGPSDDVGLSESVCAEPAVITKDLKEELSSENKAGEASEMVVMKETIPPSEPVQSIQSVPVTVCETDSEMTERIEEKQVAADIHPMQAEEPVEDEDAVEIQPSVEEKLEVQATVGQKVKISAESDSEEQSKDVVVQKTKTISLLDSSDDEDNFDEEEEELISDEDDLGGRAQRRGEPSNMSEEASVVDGLFMIDTRPGQDADQQFYREEEEDADKGAAQGEEDEEFIDDEGGEDDDEDSKVLFSSRNSQLKELSSRIDPGLRVKELGGLYISFDGSKSKPVFSSLQNLEEKKSQDEVMKKSVIGPDFEKKDAVPPYSESKQALKLKRRAEREKSTGDGWFNMKAPEISQELKGDLQVLKMRGSLDPKRFYKKNDRDGFPKYFQVGTVVDSPADFYHSRIPKKERKRTMVEELLNDAEFRQKNKKKYQQIIAEKAAQAAGKRNKKKKFHKKK
ncbi:deoxynucleotidyltransferase terminal-interacting protein 2 isoform X1 [Girardinichthys multiradiatus]|uniref:deoxynucleotidyltransferase terminal-interacting protein 2 isoform X1 n=2 Tax=Girardinichthys multiradiatus TaxID=208333 RepID=UPI001FADCE06|nr:deoxynucleotidyltransferase terminal-interacting protein 2 isoform X1 [Girardinichthys multiradiatus]